MVPWIQFRQCLMAKALVDLETIIPWKCWHYRPWHFSAIMSCCCVQNFPSFHDLPVTLEVASVQKHGCQSPSEQVLGGYSTPILLHWKMHVSRSFAESSSFLDTRKWLVLHWHIDQSWYGSILFGAIFHSHSQPVGCLIRTARPNRLQKPGQFVLRNELSDVQKVLGSLASSSNKNSKFKPLESQDPKIWAWKLCRIRAIGGPRSTPSNLPNLRLQVPQKRFFGDDPLVHSLAKSPVYLKQTRLQMHDCPIAIMFNPIVRDNPMNRTAAIAGPSSPVPKT